MLHRIVVTGILLTASAFAQMSSFPKRSYFRETFQKPQTQVQLRDPVRLKDFVVSGKLELSLKNYLELVMANNTDVQLQLLTLVQPKDAITTALGAWDPTAVASFSATRSTSLPISATEAQSTNAITKSLSQPYRLQYSQAMPEGTQYSVSYSGAKSSQTNSYQSFNPSLTSNLAVNITQPLLRNRGSYVNHIPLMQAQSRYKVADYLLRQQLLGLVSGAETVYWNYISARENLRVQEGARDTAAKYLAYMQQQLDLGAISALDIYNPKQNLAAAELAVASAAFGLRSAEDAVRHQVAADLHPEVRKLALVLTETVDLGAADSLTVDPEAKVGLALANHPAIRQALENLGGDDLSIQSARNGLLPDLRLSAQYTTQGRGGIFYPSQSQLPGGGGTIGTPLETVPGGFGDAFSQMWGFGYPVYNVGLTLTLPIRNRAASAAMADAQVRKKSDALTLRNQQQGIRLNILNAVTNLEGSKEQLKLAKIQKDFASLNLDAENQKYELGTSTNQYVINAQQALLQAESAVVTNQIAVRKNLLNLLLQSGELLDERGIVVTPQK
jgi:outer membrane protein TolC